MNKKHIPFDIITAIEPTLKANSDIIAFKKEANCYYSIYDTDKGSPFFFKLYIDPKKTGVTSSIDSSKEIYCALHPKTGDSKTAQSMLIDRQNLSHTFGVWVELIKTYNAKESVYDDPFLRTYQQFYYHEFKSAEEDANWAPFDPAQQEVIENFLHHVEQKLLEYRKSASKEETETIDEILDDVYSTIDELTISTKNKAISEISKIFAKMFKLQKELAKQLYKKAKDEVIDVVVRVVMKNGYKFFMKH